MQIKSFTFVYSRKPNTVCKDFCSASSRNKRSQPFLVLKPRKIKLKTDFKNELATTIYKAKF